MEANLRSKLAFFLSFILMIVNKPYFSTFLLLVTLFCVSNCQQAKPKTTSTAPKEAVEQTPISSPDTIKKEIVETKTYDYDTLQWLDILDLDTSIQVDMKYATTDNFVKEKMYECGRCLLRPDAAKAVAKAHIYLQGKGYGLKMLDCYRPRPIQQKLWDKVPNPTYVTNPAKGSMHNRGLAVDLTLVDENGKELEMGTPFDFFGPKAHTFFADLPDDVLANRKLLRETLKKFGFKHITSEWWHYSYQGARSELSDYLWECE